MAADLCRRRSKEMQCFGRIGFVRDKQLIQLLDAGVGTGTLMPHGSLKCFFDLLDHVSPDVHHVRHI